MNDKVKCNNCGFAGVVEKGADKCPQCCAKGFLEWQDHDHQETDEAVTLVKTEHSEHQPAPGAGIWLQEGEQTGKADGCACRLIRNHAGSEDPAFVMCPVHEAAPELLAVCEKMVDDWHDDDNNMDRPEPKYLEMARAAIAKAKGGAND